MPKQLLDGAKIVGGVISLRREPVPQGMACPPGAEESREGAADMVSAAVAIEPAGEGPPAADADGVQKRLNDVVNGDPALPFALSGDEQKTIIDVVGMNAGDLGPAKATVSSEQQHEALFATVCCLQRVHEHAGWCGSIRRPVVCASTACTMACPARSSAAAP